MKLKFSWLKSRKSLIFCSAIDIVLLSFIFFNTFKNSILENSLLLFFSIVNTFVWIIFSYVIGRYSNFSEKKINIIIKQFIKLLLVVFFNLFFVQILFRFFWNWNYMNFESFSNFLNYLLSFYSKIFLSSGLSQLFLNIYFSKKLKEKSTWLFLGDNYREEYLKTLIDSKTKFKIEVFKHEKFANSKNNLKGIIIDDEKILEKKNIQFLFDLNNRGMKFMKVSNWCERYLNRFPSELVKATEIIEGQFNYNEFSFKARIKRISESFLSLIILIMALPILLIASFLIKLEDGGPIFYTQTRNGFEGKEFNIIKLRTMIVDAEKNGAQWSRMVDKRITKIGRILRKLRIDELPQLLLVISGEMSLIGPRPERSKIDLLLRKNIPNYDLRYSIKPGISGWAQVNCPYGASIEDSKLKLSYDLYYIKNFSILLDFMILFKTLRIVLNGKGSKPIKK